jgi:septum formation protein
VRLVLASASPRRRELLSLLNVEFDIRPADVVEDVGDEVRADIITRRLAREKAEAVRLEDTDAWLLAADTVVVHQGVILGKPRDAREAREMLERLRGQTHEVVTAVAVLPPRQRSALIGHSVTVVTMRMYADEEIDASISRGDPFDKAGGYAIQADLLRPVESYEGCYCNVMGLPLWPTIELLRKAGFPLAGRVDDLLPQCAACPLRPAGG